ncbi:MAG TPA: hypothetical protein VF071_04915 [Candidatus Limnocylindria bacterium]
MPPLSIIPRRRGLVALFATAMALSACGGSTASSGGGTPSPAPSAESMAPSAEPSAEAPQTTFTFASADPVVTREQTGVDEAFINPGAVFEHDGEFHMFANLFTGFPGVSQVPHLTSPDGETWTLAEAAPVLTTQGIDFAPTGAHVSSGFVTDDGTWVLILESLTSLEPWRLGRATAPAPEGPWTVDPQPILEPQDGGFDAGGLSWPTVVRTDDGYAMYYTARAEAGGPGVIAMAISPDGATWTRTAEPVLEASAEWEDGSLDRPRVAVTPNGLVMVYSGADLTDRGVATSQDGVTWQRDGELPVITQDDFPVDGRCWDASLLYRDGMLHYILEIGSGSASGGGTQLYLASAQQP